MAHAGNARNLDDIRFLGLLFTCPHIGVKQLNVLYAIRNAYSSRGFLVARERSILLEHFATAVRLKVFEDAEALVAVAALAVEVAEAKSQALAAKKEIEDADKKLVYTKSKGK